MISLPDSHNSRIETELQLLNQSIDFSGAYLAVQYLYLHIKKSLKSIGDQTVEALFSVLESDRHKSQKQAYFLYKEAADALIHICFDLKYHLSFRILSDLQSLLLRSAGKKHRAVSEALGSLPVSIQGPTLEEQTSINFYKISFDALLAFGGSMIKDSGQWQGRTWIYQLNGEKKACIKFARSDENIKELSKESEWLKFLSQNPPCHQTVFSIPVPVSIQNHHVFKIENPPQFISKNKKIHPDCIAIMFIAENEYFHYANEPCYFMDQKSAIKEVYRRNAWLLGRLTAMGVIHKAIIPLFHNRAQQLRREDRGLYIWEQGGRLDKWLESCRYPNFSKSGLRDFEHLAPLNNRKELRHIIGEHILGFILVMGSFFRNKAPDQKGFDMNGHPLDMRNLFDRELFSELINETVEAYYHGVTGIPLKNLSHFLNDTLIDRLIDTMGVDQHMEEILRIQDQINMSDDDFKHFLISRGYDESIAESVPKAQNDIVLNTGPHLGGFNQTISVPELIDFLFCLSSLCISDRFIMENGLKASRN